MSEENPTIRRLTEGDNLPQEAERYDVIVRPAPGPNPPDLLQQIVADIKDSLAELTPIAGKAVGKYVGAKGEEAVARVQEIRARICESLGKLEIERQRLVQDRDKALDSHAEKMMELKTQRLREKSQAFKEIVDCLVRLKEKGIRIDMKVIKKKITEAMTELLEDE
jgi:hypothetical protein